MSQSKRALYRPSPPGAQLVELQSAVLEVEGSGPRPDKTLRLPLYIFKWFNVQVLSDKNYKLINCRSRLPGASSVSWLARDVNEPTVTLVEKSREGTKNGFGMAMATKTN